MARRASYIKGVLAENPNTVIVESGDLAYYGMDPTNPAGQLEAVADGLKAMGYTAVGVGTLDVRFANKYYEILKARGIPVVHVDVSEQDGALPYLVKDFGGIKVGIVSFGAVSPDKKDSFALFKQRYRVFMEARQGCDILVLLDQGNVANDDWLQRNAERLGSPDIVIGGPSRGSLTEPRQIGKTMIVPTSTQGTYVGRVDVEVNASETRMGFVRTLMDEPIKEDPDMAKLVKDYVARSRRALTSQPAVTPIEPYYAYQTCKPCHSSEYDQWKGTPHAAALQTLLDQGKTIAECLVCHSEMYRKSRRITLSSREPAGVECATCHASVVPHGADYKKKGDTQAIRAQCATCHTKERSPNFDPAAAYTAVKHSKQ